LTAPVTDYEVLRVFCVPGGQHGNELGVVRRGNAVPTEAGRIDEDEATGAAALALTAHLGRALDITQGRGSQILTAPRPGGTIEVGGRVRPADAG
jgi:predicted PhzF superfamily epimerase YddE/YHI9